MSVSQEESDLMRELHAAQQTIADLRAEVERLRGESRQMAGIVGCLEPDEQGRPSCDPSPGGCLPYRILDTAPAPPVPRPPMLRAKPKHLDGYQWFLRGEHYHCWFSEDGRYASEMLEIDRENSDEAAIVIYEKEVGG